jgi:hypothetical protein
MGTDSYHFYLARLDNCNGEERFETWRKHVTEYNRRNNLEPNCALLGNTNIGCGLNSLTFLDILSFEQGLQLVNQVNNNGTTFEEMINYVARASNNNALFHEFRFNITNLAGISAFLNLLNTNLPNNSCTIAKLNRHSDVSKRPVACQRFTPGHSIVFSKDNFGKLWTIDPQQCSRLERNDAKIAQSWSTNCYVSASLMYTISVSPPAQLKPVPSDYPVQNFNRAEIPMDYVPMDVAEDDEDTAMDVAEDEPLPPRRGGKTRNAKKVRNLKKVKKTRKTRK